MKPILLSFFLSVLALGASAQKYAGGDISMLTHFEDAGTRYLDYSGKAISGSALDFFKQEGMNLMRVRLFVAPEKYQGAEKDANACQDFDYILPICKRIVNAGLPLILDFHYSDTWADPAKQWTPADWANLTDEQLYDKIYEYTKETLLALKAEGVTPAFIQTGNEISYGMLWGTEGSSNLKKCYSGSDANWNRFTTLLKRAGEACREVCPDAGIILHTERVANISVQNNFYNKMKAAGVDYDIIGLSYYPYFHGNLDKLNAALSSLENQFPDKRIMLVELGYPINWAVPGTTYDYSATYPYTDAGQAAFIRDLVAKVKTHSHVDGLVWWWPEYNAYGTNLSGWYNAPLFNSLNGRATTATRELCAFAENSGVENVEIDHPQATDSRWFTIAGVELPSRPTAPGLYIYNNQKVIIK